MHGVYAENLGELPELVEDHVGMVGAAFEVPDLAVGDPRWGRRSVGAGRRPDNGVVGEEGHPLRSRV